jgi:hypothetical protein
MIPKGARKISNDAAIFMTGIAIFLDLVAIAVEIIPVGGFVLGFVLDALIAVVFSMWFDHYHVNLWGKNATGSFIALGMNAFPITDLTFPWAIRVGSLAFTAREEIPKEAEVTISPWRL